MARPEGERRRGARGRRAELSPTANRALLRAGIYLAALPVLLLVYGTKERALFTAAPVALVGAGVVWLLGSAVSADRERTLLYAAAVGATLGELTWALGYWSTLPLVGGAALWLALYALSGVAEHALARTLDRQVVLEYGGVALLGVLLVLVSQPWRP